MNVTDELIIFFGCGRHELEAALAGTAEMEFGEALEETVRTMGLRQLKSKQVAKFGYFALSMDRDSRLVIPCMLLGVIIQPADNFEMEPTCIKCTVSLVLLRESGNGICFCSMMPMD